MTNLRCVSSRFSPHSSCSSYSSLLPLLRIRTHSIPISGDKTSFIWSKDVWNVNVLSTNLSLINHRNHLLMGYNKNLIPMKVPRVLDIHMAQFLQGGKNGCFVSLFLFTESLREAKPCKTKLIFQLILVDWVFCIVKTSWLTLRKIFGVPCSTPVLALLSIFWVKMR